MSEEIKKNKKLKPSSKKTSENKKKKETVKTSKKSKGKKKEADVKKDKPIEIEYFGHNDGDDIWASFLIEKLIAHRGLHDDESPENTLSAFEKAIEKGYAIEIDVNPIEDGTPVVFHDSKMSRLTGKDKYIQKLTREELKTTKILNSEETIPTLEEVLNYVNGRAPLLIEIKTQQKVGELEKKVWELLRKYKGEYAIQSFDPYCLQWFHKNAPKVWRGQLAGFFKDEHLSLIKKLVLRRLGMKKITKHNFVSYDIKNLPNRYVKRLEVPLLSWTIKTQQQYIKAIQYSDNVIFQDFEPTI